MDTTLWGYLKKSEEEGLEDVMDFMGMVEKVEGLFTLLWHQEAVRMKGGRIYWRILQRLARRKHVFVGSGADIARWWRAREVPLMVDRIGRQVSLGGLSPEGLTLRLRTREGTRVKVTDGSIAMSAAAADERLVSPSGPAFRLEVLGAK
jgi:hypothetical protein